MEGITFNTLLLVGSIVVGFNGFLKAIDSIVDIYKKHSVKDAMHKELEACKEDLEKELSEHKKLIDFHSELLSKDKAHFDKVDKDIDMVKTDFLEIRKESDKQFEVLVKTMLALVSYSLDNSNKDDLKKAQKDLTDYLASH